MRTPAIFVFLALILATSALYDKYSAVKLLTASDFSQVKKGIWLVEFFAPWCGHCKSLAPEYEKAAKALKGIANIAAIDASNEQTDIQIQGYPTIKLFIDGKVTEYDGPRSADGVVDFMLKKFRNIANERLGGGSSGSHSHSHSDSGSGGLDEKDVIVLTDATFDSVYEDELPWFVEFYAPWCGHCKNLVPEYAELATNLKGQVKVAKVDATEQKESASKFGVSGYPTIKFFPGGKKDEGSAINYDGQRTASAMAEWAREKTKDLKHFQHVRILSQKDYDDTCKSKFLCVLTFLPHILDSNQEERQKYLDQIKEVGLKFRGKPFKFAWVQGGDHFEFEEKIGVVSMYPISVVIFENKKIMGKLLKSFNEELLSDYLETIIKNKARMSHLPELPKLKTIKDSSEAFGEEELCTSQKDCGGEDL